jgi:alpha-L-rhamnosidase
VAGDPKRLETDTGDLWDSGKVMSDRSIQIAYDGVPLKSQIRCYWKVRVWDRDGKPSGWSKPAYWTMGLLSPDDWKARWIAFDASRKRPEGAQKLDLSKAKWIWSGEGNAAAGAPIGTRYFRTEFVLQQGREVVSANCAVTADNSFKMFLNGRRIRNGNNFKDRDGRRQKYLLLGKNARYRGQERGRCPNLRASCC